MLRFFGKLAIYSAKLQFTSTTRNSTNMAARNSVKDSFAKKTTRSASERLMICNFLS